METQAPRRLTTYEDNMTKREKLQHDAIALARDLRNRGLYALSKGLSDAADGALSMAAEAESRKTVEAVALSLDAERRLTYLFETCQRTLEDMANAPLGRGAKHVRAFGVELEPHQALGVAAKLTAAADELIEEQNAVRLVDAVYGEPVCAL